MKDGRPPMSWQDYLAMNVCYLIVFGPLGLLLAACSGAFE